MLRYYFAFGSNMSTARLQARIAEARPCGRAELRGWRFACNKRGLDGSAKANIEPAADEVVWGVLFTMPEHAFEELDVIEGGYERTEVEVMFEGERVPCLTYASTRMNDDRVPFDWYKAHILHGATEHDLPAEYVARLRALPQRSPIQ